MENTDGTSRRIPRRVSASSLQTFAWLAWSANGGSSRQAGTPARRKKKCTEPTVSSAPRGLNYVCPRCNTFYRGHNTRVPAHSARWMEEVIQHQRLHLQRETDDEGTETRVWKCLSLCGEKDNPASLLLHRSTLSLIALLTNNSDEKHGPEDH